MSIDPVVPVHMAGQILLNSSWQSTWAPVIAASIAGVFSAIVTFLIVRWTSKDAQKQLTNSYQLTVDSIAASNEKALKEMKASLEKSQQIAVESIYQNRLLEEKKIAMTARKDWLDELTEILTEMMTNYSDIEDITTQVEDSDLSLEPETEQKEKEQKKLLDDFTIINRNIYRGRSKLTCMLDGKEASHGNLLSALLSKEEEVRRKFSKTMKGETILEDDFTPDLLLSLAIQEVICDARSELFGVTACTIDDQCLKVDETA